MKLAIDRFIPAGDVAGMNRVALWYFLILISGFVLEFTQTWLLQNTGQRIMFDMRMEIYAHLQRLDLRFYDRNPVGRLMTRVTTDVDVINDLFTSGVVSVFGDIFTLAGIMIVMLSMNWKLALVAFAVLPLIFVITQWFRRNVRESYRTVRRLIARINAYLQEHITGMATVQLFRREPRMLRRFDEINEEHLRANVESIFYYAVFYPAIEIVGALAAALTIWYGGRPSCRARSRSARWSRSCSTRSGSSVRYPICRRSSTSCRPRWPRPSAFSSCSTNRFTSSRRRQPFAPRRGPRTSAHGPRTSNLDPRATSSSITCGSPTTCPRRASPSGCCATCRSRSCPASASASSGATGAGKSTLINLLLRFYDVTRGRILVDGVDVRELDLHQLRGLFSLVLQDVHLFSGTIAENIRLGDGVDCRRRGRARRAPRSTPTPSSRACPTATRPTVAERGSTLSVGQKQLLSFARALAFDPRILVLDEATSSVDTETEILIRDALHVLMSGRTTIAIAHRLSTIQDMDKILVLHKGKLRESGTHQQLLAARGIYFKLYQLQYKDQERLETPATDDFTPSAQSSQSV